MTTLRRLGLVLLNLVVASPFFYYVDGASTTKERVYPLRIIAMGAASQYVELNEKETGRVRNLTVSEHLVTAMLTPAVMLRVGNDTSKQGQNATYMAVNAIPLIACGAPAPMCKPSEVGFWNSMQNADVALVASWAVAICTACIPFASWRRNAAQIFNALLIVGMLTFGVVCFAINRYRPTLHFLVSLALAGNEFSYLRQEQRNTSTLEALVKPGDQKAAAAAKVAKPQKKESKKAK